MLILDVVMPDLGGRETYELAKRVRPTIPVLFTSGYDESTIHADFMLCKGMTLLEKPYGIRTLLAQVRGILDDHRHCEGESSHSA